MGQDHLAGTMLTLITGPRLTSGEISEHELATKKAGDKAQAKATHATRGDKSPNSQNRIITGV